MKKYIFVTGGVCSSLGKGITAASIGTLLESRGIAVDMVKVDPYINVDAGTMSPYQHGEVYVTDDGAETDLDLGNYFRFTSAPLSRANSITTGQIYRSVIEKEREGRYLGKTVQVIPHITDEIKRRIREAGGSGEVTIIEIGGTVGDIESIPFLEAARQFYHDVGRENVLYIHLTLVPRVASGELKTKPTQHSVGTLREIGIQPDILLCRTPGTLDQDMKRKIALFTNLDEDAVLSANDVKTTIYEIPLDLQREGLDDLVVKKLGFKGGRSDLSAWKVMVDGVLKAKKTLRIAVVGKYINLDDSYKSIYEALRHGGISQGVAVELLRLDSEELEKSGSPEASLSEAAGILIPGGFGSRGIEGMISAARYAREKNIPYFGICLGMQIMVVEYARNVCSLPDANSTEISPETPHPVISLLEEQVGLTSLGGTMRLGKSETLLRSGTLPAESYGATRIFERHRHRYEVSNLYRTTLEEGGLVTAGTTADGTLVESVLWPGHPWGVGVQYHPEFTSKPLKPHPLFVGFLEAACRKAFGEKK
ncbi:MAG: CTP synthase [Spirochaetales bacterium]|nr:CTP synthase [Spirochaetales bacterium]